MASRGSVQLGGSNEASAVVATRCGDMIEFSQNPCQRLCAFRCGRHKRALVVIGGQTDAFFSLNYIDKLTEELVGNIGYSVVQPLFSSWYSGFGESTLENDTEELDSLIAKLLDLGVSDITLLGHGTGAQDVMHYFSAGRFVHAVTRVVLQGGVRDPSLESHDYDALQNARDEAVRMIRQGRGNALMPKDTHPQPISAFRFLALGGRHGVKDFFNPLQGADAMQLVLGHITVPCLTFLCLTDTYTPTAEQRSEISDMIQESMPEDVRLVWLDAACDENLNFLRGFEEEITYEISTFLQHEDRKAREREADRLRGELAEDRRKRSVVFQSRSGGLKRSPSQVSVSSNAPREHV